MRRMISIVDLSTGRLTEREGDTPTFDLPLDFDRQTAGAALDSKAQAHYSATGGTSVIRALNARPLSWRAKGEQCLVASGTRAATPAQPSNYKLCAIVRTARPL